MMTFEEIQEKCIQNKENVDKWSKLLSSVLVCALLFIAYYNVNTWGKFVLIAPIGISIYHFVIKKTNYDRIFTKFPAVLGVCLIIILSVYLFYETSFFADGLTVKCLIRWILLAICAWLIGFSIHIISINILDSTFFANPILEYTTKIVKFEEETRRRKHYGTVHYYYAYFYDYSFKLNKTSISKLEYDTWRKGDVVRAELQPSIEGINVEKVTLLRDFNGLTDWENDVQKHRIEVEQFGSSQEEKDAAKGKVKILSFVWLFVFLTVIFAFPYTAYETQLNELMTLCPPLYIGLAVGSLIVICLISYKEYKRIVEKYTLEDVKIWRDFFVPRGLLYFLVVFGIFGMILSIYNEANDEYFDEVCTVSKLTDDNKLTFERPDGTIRTQKEAWYRLSELEEGSKIEVSFRRGALGFDFYIKFNKIENKD